MSYDKAMKHTRNVRKCRKQARQYMGFDTGSGRWPSSRSTPHMAAWLSVRDWFKERHRGDKAYNRECIREAIADCRAHEAVMRNQAAIKPGQLALF